MEDYKPQYDRQGAVSWYSRGHTGYFMKDMIGSDSRIDIIREWVSDKFLKQGKIVDIGCGDMSLANLMPGYEWTGFDLDPKKDPRIIKQDISSCPYAVAAQSFDGLICSEVLEHVFEPHVVIAEFNRILKIGGWAIITVPNFDNFEFYLGDHTQLLFDTKKFWTLEHIRWFNHQNMGELLNGRGFKIHEIRGSAHCFSGIFQYAADQLIKYMKSKHNTTLTIGEAGSILGKLIPMYAPGLSFLCEKVM